MNIFNVDNTQIQLFIDNVEKIIGNLSTKAKKEDIEGLEKLVKNFKMKTEDFYRENRKLNIGVIGQVKAGKSSFLNTLLFDGKEILPKASTPKTATLTKMEYSEKNIIEIEYYTVDEWEVLERNAEVDFDDEAYISAREIVGMVRRNGINPLSYLKKGKDEIEFATYEDLISHLNDYVGEDGKFTPIVKAVTLYLNKEEFKGLSIVDTPGLNDPIASRTIRTKEFMEVCDVVFFLSQCEAFLDTSDWTLLSSQLPQKGVKRLVLIGSKYDSSLRSVLRKQEDGDDIFDKDESKTDSIPDACEMISRKLERRSRYMVEDYVRNLEFREKEAELIEVIKQCSEPVFVSAIAYNMINKSVDAYTYEEKDLYAILKQFSNDIENDLKLLGNFETVKEIFAEVVKEKEDILEQKAKSFIPTEVSALKALLNGYKEKANKRLAVLESNDKDQLLEQKNLVEAQIGKIKADIAVIFGDLNVKLETEKGNGLRALREASKDYHEIRERVGERVVYDYYTVSDSKWYKIWTWGKSHKAYTTHTERYSYCMASDAIDNLRNYAVDAVNHVENVFTEAIELKELKRKLLNVVINNFDMGSEKYDSSLFRIMVEEAISAITFPAFSMDISTAMNGIAGKFTGEITSASEKTELSAALSTAISRIYDELGKNLTDTVNSYKENMNHIGKKVQDSLLDNINKEFNELLEQYEDKEKEIADYKSYALAVESELARL